MGPRDSRPRLTHVCREGPGGQQAILAPFSVKEWQQDQAPAGLSLSLFFLANSKTVAIQKVNRQISPISPVIP